MPSKDSRQPLLDILENIRLARVFVAGLSYADFLIDRRTVYAVTRALEIISEAARRLPDELLERYPHLPWKDIKGAGNVYSAPLQRMFPTNNHTFLIIFNSLSHFFPKSVVTKIDPVLVKRGLF